MTSCVLDASVAAKWFLPPAHETLVPEAQQVLHDYAEGNLRLLVPDLFWPEFGNIMWKATRQGRISQKSAVDAISAMERRNIPTASGLPMLHDAYLMAAAFERTVYDSMYVTLAVMSGAPLITADERLANALAARFPVRWLGSL
ncbi:MAG TPA: type II toxin-antitoxin system VapC family toxin [Candidatus Acidoferrales bacterium]|nr:type II toxin-antitoxin system VapC family toxin [Candidatus Acidoferrales bacterium]